MTASMPVITGEHLLSCTKDIPGMCRILLLHDLSGPPIIPVNDFLGGSFSCTVRMYHKTWQGLHLTSHLLLPLRIPGLLLSPRMESKLESRLRAREVIQVQDSAAFRSPGCRGQW